MGGQGTLVPHAPTSGVSQPSSTPPRTCQDPPPQNLSIAGLYGSWHVFLERVSHLGCRVKKVGKWGGVAGFDGLFSPWPQCAGGADKAG